MNWEYQISKPKESEMSFTRSFNDALPFGSGKLYIDLTIPMEFDKKIPITVFISDTPANVQLGAYVYTIGRDKDTYHTILNQTASQDLLDLAYKFSKVLWRKFQTPIYFNLSGSYDPFEYLQLIKLVIDFIDAKVLENAEER